MQCPVCFDDITTASGKAELSCSHTFHIKCLSTWFSKTETCPCCRHEANTTEKIYKEEDDSESDYETGPLFTQLSLQELLQMAAAERARHLFQKLKFLNPAYEVELYSVISIQKFYRAYRIRKEYSEIRRLSKTKKDTIKALFNIRHTLISLHEEHNSRLKEFTEKYITSCKPQQTTQPQQQ